MKHFFIIRHAKSSWSDFSLKDIDRPLNKRGIHDAPKMAHFIKEIESIDIHHIYSSPANRALTTAQYFHKAFEIKNPIDIRLDIYHADIEDLIHIIENTDDSVDSFAIFGHNPGFTYLVNHYSIKQIENLPTCGIAHFESTADSWLEIKPTNTRLINFLVPKKTIY